MKIFLLLMLAVNSYCVYSQPSARDTAWYVELKDSTILYSKKLMVINAYSGDEYILLDNNKKIPMSQVIRYRSRAGEYIREKGPVESYRLEKNGPRLFVYSRSYLYPDSTGYREGRDYYFRKDNSGDMVKMSYKSLMGALADNPASMRQLRAARSAFTIGLAGTALSLLVTTIGGLSNYRENVRRRNENPRAKSYLSPALPIGCALFLASITITFTAPGHIQRAVNIYNR